MRRLKDCLAFFWLRGRLLIGLSGACLYLGGGGARLRAVFSGMAASSTEQAQIVVELPLSFLLSQLPIFPEFIGERGGAAGGRRGFSWFVSLVAILGVVAVAVVVAVAAAGSRSRGLVVGFRRFAVMFVGNIGLALAMAGLLTESFPVTGVDGVRKGLHGFESRRFSLLTHYVLDSFR